MSRISRRVLVLYSVCILFRTVFCGSARARVDTPASASEGFTHPGMLHTQKDLDRMKAMVAAHAEPWLSGFLALQADPRSSATYELRGPFLAVARGPGTNLHKTEVEQDADAAYQNAVMWCITGQEAHAKKSIEILNAWSHTLKSFGGRDVQLGAGLDGFKFMNAAEMMRYTYKGWSPADIAQFRNFALNVIYPPILDFASFANGNWDGACIKTNMAIGVFCDNRAIFNKAVDYFYNGKGDGRLTKYVFNVAGQCQESGRDQAHTQLGLGQLAEACQIGWNQGLDMFAASDNRLLKGFEYTAKYNLGGEVPYTPDTDSSGRIHWDVISTIKRGELHPVYEMVLNHYQNLLGVPAPYTQRAAEKTRPEGAAFAADDVGFGTLLFSLPPYSKPVPPSAGGAR